MPIVKNKQEIHSLSDWNRLARPKRPEHWVHGRSAMELARAWLDDADLPGEVRAAIERHGDFGPVRAWSAEPEARLRFDKFAGEPRNTDLLIDAKDMHGRYLIAVEGKADEPFGETVGDALAAALERRIANHR